MSRTDLVSDCLASLKNAIVAKKDEVIIPYSKLLFKICEILKTEGYIENFRQMEEAKKVFLKVYLRYRNKKSVVSTMRRISKPSLRVYVKKDKVPRVLRGKGLALISTSQGLFTDKEARQRGIGGEVLFYIW
ncbi:MAG: 30S ribosomal protein S8 [Candidatus Omnitrophica bacterium]|nr:30S ribosomal protein S8 [Candidatus Omnitrophota bacterium]